MNAVFADTFYWHALTNPHDGWHQRAKSMSERLQSTRIVTTDEVLLELLASFCDSGEHWRRRAVEVVKYLHDDPDTDVYPQSRSSFLRGLTLYENRLDKSYSLVDCVSMHTMRELGIKQVLTGDRHFEQEGFEILFRDE